MLILILSLDLLEHPLAKGFLLTDGHVRVEVPDVNDGDNYIIVRKCLVQVSVLSVINELISRSSSVMGDSGNRSPEFTISSR